MKAGVALIVLLAGLPDGAAADDAGRRLPPTPQVVDAADRLVGPATAVADRYVLVGLPAGGRTVIVLVGPTGFLAASRQVRYELDGCQGPPVLLVFPQPGVAPLEPAVGLGPGQQLLIESGAAPTTVTVRSFWNSTALSPGCSALPPGSTAEVVPTQVLADLSGFQPPFSLR
jgi:hypothetical protein